MFMNIITIDNAEMNLQIQDDVCSVSFVYGNELLS